MSRLKNAVRWWKRDIDLIENRKIRRVREACKGLCPFGGTIAVAVYETLIDFACESNGYYVEWEGGRIAEDVVNRLAESELKISTVKEIIYKMVENGLLDQQMFDHHNILTSEGIQERHEDRMKESRRKFNVDERYNLLIAKSEKNSPLRDENSQRGEENSQRGEENEYLTKQEDKTDPFEETLEDRYKLEIVKFWNAQVKEGSELFIKGDPMMFVKDLSRPFFKTASDSFCRKIEINEIKRAIVEFVQTKDEEGALWANWGIHSVVKPENAQMLLSNAKKREKERGPEIGSPEYYAKAKKEGAGWVKKAKET